MTDTSPGPGWWLASDGNWYPPHLHPNARAAAAAQVAIAPTATPYDAARTAANPAAAMAAIEARPDARPDAVAAMALDPRPDDSLLASFGVPTGHDALAPSHASSVPGGAPPAASIDWEDVARQRAEQRAARQRQEAARRRVVGLVVVSVVALVGVVGVALALRDGESAEPATVDQATVTTASTASAARGSTSAAPPVTSAPSGTISVFSLQPGSCIDQENLTTGLVTSVRTVPCTESHTHEVYHRATITPVDSAYEAAKVTAFADKACTEGFTSYVGVPYEQSKYYYVHLAPSEESWNKNRDRDVVCLLLHEGQRLTSSVKGKGE
jgi:hypothetical protein